MRDLTAHAGLEGAVIFNTCAVTNEATRQARQAIRKVARERPGAPIIVTGCAAQIAPESFAALPGVARVIGNHEKLDQATWDAALAPSAPKVAVGNIMAVAANAPHLISAFAERARAYIEVQNGCDHRCTFCIIPFGRGVSRSVPGAAVARQVRTLAEAGYKEVVLTGVDLTSWGADLDRRASLGALVREILDEVPELARLRLSSIDVAEIDEALMELFAGEERLMPHLHLSLQSGDDMILKRMKRRHSRAEAIRLTQRLRESRADIVFGADLIAGFPTESEEMFENSLRLVDECGLSFLHVFPFSPKAGTPAARMPPVAGPVIKARARALREKGRAALARHLVSQVGREGELLMEAANIGRLPGFTPARLAGSAGPGALIRVRITGHDGERLVAARAGHACARPLEAPSPRPSPRKRGEGGTRAKRGRVRGP
jgi:threonylcarbamoyladenosine tRNA methylthiotransferase MtaB